MRPNDDPHPCLAFYMDPDQTLLTHSDPYEYPGFFPLLDSSTGRIICRAYSYTPPPPSFILLFLPCGKITSRKQINHLIHRFNLQEITSIPPKSSSPPCNNNITSKESSSTSAAFRCYSKHKYDDAAPTLSHSAFLFSRS